MSLLKKLLLAVAALVIILVVAIASIPLWFDINDYKATLVSQFEQHTGRRLDIPGKLKLSVFPEVAVKTGQISIGNAKSFGKQPFARLEQLQLGVKLLPLFSQRIEAEEILVSGLELNLARNAKGQSNWDDLIAAKAQPTTEKKPSTTKAEPVVLPDFGLAGVRIENARLNWQDKQAGETWQAELKRLQLGAVRFDVSIPFSAELNATDTQKTRLALNAQGQFSINPLITRLSVPELKLDTTLNHPSLAKAVKPALQINKLSFDMNKQKLDIPDLRISFEDTQIQGSLGATLSPAIQLDYKLNIDQLDVDRLLALLPAEQPSAKQAATTKDVPAAAIPFAAMTAIPANGKIAIGRMTVMNTHWTDIEMQTRASKGHLQLKPLKLSGYGTTIASDASIDTRQASPSVQANLAMNGLQISPLLKDMLNKDKLHGEANIKAAINTQGHTVTELKQQLAGQFSMSLDKGIIKGIDLSYHGDALKALAKGEAAPAKPADPQTEFAQLTASGLIRNGVINNQDLRASTLFARCAGQGEVDIVRETINYTLMMKTTSSAKALEGKTYEQLDRDPLDIRITGPWNDISIKPDYQKALKQQVKQKLEPKKQEVKKKIDEKLDKKKQEATDKVKDKLKSLFK